MCAGCFHDRDLFLVDAYEGRMTARIGSTWLCLRISGTGSVSPNCLKVCIICVIFFLSLSLIPDRSIGGWDARDPMVINLGPAYNNTYVLTYAECVLTSCCSRSWAMYYCATTPDSGSDSVHHVDYVRCFASHHSRDELSLQFQGAHVERSH